MAVASEAVESLRRDIERWKIQWNEQIEGIKSQFDDLLEQIRLQDHRADGLRTEFDILNGAVDLIAQRNQKKLKDLSDKLSAFEIKTEGPGLERNRSEVQSTPEASQQINIPLNKCSSAHNSHKLKKVVAPPHTPNVVCFVNHPDGFPEHKANECELFMVRYSANDRARLIAKQSRCFSCWEVGSFDQLETHSSLHCDHVRFCGSCLSGSHHAALCGAHLVTKKKQPNARPIPGH